MKISLGFLCVLAFWVMAVLAGFAALMRYATTPGAAGPAAVMWPTASVLTPDPQRANLVVLAHPRCPCTRATMDELERLLTRCQGLVAVHVLLYRPHASPENWEKTDLWQRAAALPGASVQADDDGIQAGLFGAATSGHVLLYDRDGRLLFSGGITNTRGHAGASDGADAILSLLTGAIPGPIATTAAAAIALSRSSNSDRRSALSPSAPAAKVEIRNPHTSTIRRSGIQRVVCGRSISIPRS